MKLRLGVLFEEIKETQPAGDLVHLTPSRVHGVVPRDSLEHAGQNALREGYELKPVRPNDFVITMSSWQSGIEWVGLAGGVSPDYVPLRLKGEACDPHFLKYALKAKPIVEQLALYRTGIRQGQRLQWSKVRDATLECPSLASQQVVSSFLDNETATVDALIGNKERLLALLEAKRQAVIHRAVTKGLTANQKMQNSQVPWLGDCPTAWEIAPVKRGIIFERGHDLPEADRIPGDIPVISGAGQIGTHNVAAAVGPTVVTGRYGTIGKLHLVDGPYWPLNTALHAVSFPRLDPYYACFALSILPFSLLSDKSSNPGIDRNDLHRLQIAIPPPSEQRQIVASLDQAIAMLDKLMATLRKSLGLLHERRQALITAAVTGQLDPSVYLPKQEVVAP